VSLSDIFRNDKHFRPQMSVGIHLQEISCNITSFAAMRLIFFRKKTIGSAAGTTFSCVQSKNISSEQYTHQDIMSRHPMARNNQTAVLYVNCRHCIFMYIHIVA